MRLRVDLRTITIVRGAGFSLWNKLGRCRAVGCRGRVTFYAKAPGMDGFQAMTTPRDAGAAGKPPAWIRNRGPG